MSTENGKLLFPHISLNNISCQVERTIRCKQTASPAALPLSRFPLRPKQMLSIFQLCWFPYSRTSFSNITFLSSNWRCRLLHVTDRRIGVSDSSFTRLVFMLSYGGLPERSPNILCCVSIILCCDSIILCFVSQILCCVSQRFCCVWQIFVAFLKFCVVFHKY